MKRLFLILPLFLFLAACSGEAAGTGAGDVVEDYLEAKVAGDADAIAGLICSEMADNVNREAASFANVEAHIEGMQCTANGDTVTCTGTIIALYGQDERQFPLGSYRVVQEEGQWKWCGESE
jgi:hypothetical protein